MPRAVVAAMLAAILGSALSIAGPVAAAGVSSSGLRVANLKVDDVSDPLGIDDVHPSLSWQLASKVNGERQTSYRILVASTPERLTAGRADVWDSGKVTSNASVGVAYAGPALRSTRRYYWTVRVWGVRGGASAWARPASWEMGLLDPTDWQGARWITPDTADQDSWSDFTLDVDFTIRKGAASVLFRAQDANNLYLWQVNSAVQPGKVMLRPHLEVGGSFSHVVPDVDVSQVITQQNVNQQHHLRVRGDGAVISTWIDGTAVNTLTDGTFGKGTIGFRVGDATEDSLYDNLTVHGSTGTFSDDFSANPDPAFPQTTVTDGQLEPGGGIVLLNRDPGAPMLRDAFTLGKKIGRARAYVDGLGF